MTDPVKAILDSIDAATDAIAIRVAALVASVGLNADEKAAFQIEIKKLQALGKPPQPVSTWALFGDSVTYGWQTVAAAAPAGSVFSGSPGLTTGAMLPLLAERVLDKHVGGMLIAGGINDINGVDGPGIFPPASEISGNLIHMAETAISAGIKVVFASILPIGVFAFHPPDRQQRIIDVNATLKAYALNHSNSVYCDYYSAVIGSDGVMLLAFSPDGIHPNAAGYAVMLPIAENAMRAAEIDF